jgi:hypothetical protein
MPAQSSPAKSSARPLLTLDGWAVAAALVLALLIKLNLVHRVPW